MDLPERLREARTLSDLGISPLTDVLPVRDLFHVPERRSHFARYSKRAKDLLERYELVPLPKIIEVDLRGACSLHPPFQRASEVKRRPPYP